MASNEEVEAIASDANFEIITTFAYSAGLPYNEASLPESYCYLLQYGIDRLQAAASDLPWDAVTEDLRSIDRVQSLSGQRPHAFNPRRSVQGPGQTLHRALGLQEGRNPQHHVGPEAHLNGFPLPKKLVEHHGLSQYFRNPRVPGHGADKTFTVHQA